MLYATLEEAYNIPSFKKPKKKKTKEVELSHEVDPYDKFDSSMIVSNDHSRITSNNQCDPLQAPPYVFPIEEKAKKQYEVKNFIPGSGDLIFKRKRELQRTTAHHSLR